ncbi:MAG: hypothetical protein JO372_23300, partial [Solirubrobacterales bacterium]|nr:hypothetical protein [Solirubrobacterales bacterium]
MGSETMHRTGSIRWHWPRTWLLALITASSGLIGCFGLAGPAAAVRHGKQAARSAMSTTSITTSKFVNQFDAEPYV